MIKMIIISIEEMTTEEYRELCLWLNQAYGKRAKVGEATLLSLSTALK